MSIYDEQLPFTQEQFEYLQTKFISKNIVWHDLKETIKADKIAIPVDWARSVEARLPDGNDSRYLERQRQIVKLIDRQFEIISNLQVRLSELGSNTESTCSALESATNALDSLFSSLTSDRL